MGTHRAVIRELLEKNPDEWISTDVEIVAALREDGHPDRIGEGKSTKSIVSTARDGANQIWQKDKEHYEIKPAEDGNKGFMIKYAPGLPACKECGRPF